jgi:hypothetical protein
VTAASRDGSVVCEHRRGPWHLVNVTGSCRCLLWSCGGQKYALSVFALLRLASRVNLGAEIGSSRARLGEVAGEDRLEEGAEDDLSAATGH